MAAGAGIAGGSAHVRPAVTLVVATAAAAAIVPMGQWLFEALATATGVAAASAAVQETVFTLIIFGALLAVAAVGLTLEKAWGQLAGPAVATMAGIGLAGGVGGLLAAAGLAALAAPVLPGTSAAGAGALLAGTLLILFQAGVEEIYFRGWLQPVLSRAWGDLAGLLVTAAAFSILHMVGGDRSLLTIVNLVLGGLLFGLLAQRSGGIMLSIAAHFGWNWAESIGLGLVPNPGGGSFGAIHDIDIAGPVLWGGSPEGLNASLAMTFALVALAIPAVAWRGRAAD
ncbi:CPBP family intramembrane glutamic endopeptidase [Sandarakinorhabdus sp. DWP1-3-1]|uniref:CPBP family intramembrane glutamic endopeptidase n=1 Tax=Sandarakinorhabdus sp. DWP1-3-1 TaxID=2804627 RepID=UPI003CF9EFD4